MRRVLTKHMKESVLRWWFGLATREQRLILVVSPLLCLSAFYWLLWQPLHVALNRDTQRVVELQQQLQAFKQIKPLLMQARATPERRGGSLAQIVTNSARSFNVGVSRMQPQNEQLLLVLEDLAFEQLLTWVHQLQYQHGVRLVNLDITATERPGVVRVRRMVIE